MATIAVTDFETVFNFTLNTTKLSKGCEKTPEIFLSDLTWKIQFSKKSSGGNQKTETLSVHLVSESKRKDKNWSCDAQAAFKLLRKVDQEDISVVKYLKKTTFDNDNSCHGIDDFVDWIDLQKNYSEDNNVKFEIAIWTSPLKRKREASEAINRRSVKFQMTINDVSMLTSINSSEVVLQGVRWHVRCSKTKDHLAVHLCPNPIDMVFNWSYKVDASFTLLSMNKESMMHLEYNFSKEFVSKQPFDWGYDKFLVWTEFVAGDKIYVSKDSANLFVKLKVQEPVPRLRHTLSEVESTIKCSICLENFTSGNIFSIICGHLFCKPCFTKAMANRKECPSCKVATTSAQLHPIYFG